MWACKSFLLSDFSCRWLLQRSRKSLRCLHTYLCAVLGQICSKHIPSQRQHSFIHHTSLRDHIAQLPSLRLARELLCDYLASLVLQLTFHARQGSNFLPLCTIYITTWLQLCIRILQECGHLRSWHQRPSMPGTFPLILAVCLATQTRLQYGTGCRPALKAGIALVKLASTMA